MSKGGRDLRYPESLASDELSAPEGGLDFYRFITSELLPNLEADLRVGTTQRSLMEHSFGGYLHFMPHYNKRWKAKLSFQTSYRQALPYGTMIFTWINCPNNWLQPISTKT